MPCSNVLPSRGTPRVLLRSYSVELSPSHRLRYRSCGSRFSWRFKHAPALDHTRPSTVRVASLLTNNAFSTNRQKCRSAGHRLSLLARSSKVIGFYYPRFQFSCYFVPYRWVPQSASQNSRSAKKAEIRRATADPANVSLTKWAPTTTRWQAAKRA